MKLRRQTAAGMMVAALMLGVAFPVAAQDAADPSTESIGVNLNGIVLLGPDQPVRTSGSGMVTADGLLLIPPEADTGPLQPLLGRPISQALISEIEAEIVSAYRDAGFPFVTVVTPPQEITGGVLNLRVIPFRAANITATGTSPEVAERLVAGLRQEEGAPINATVLEEDLEWLNRSPMRRIGAEFSPGTALSTTDITLDVTEAKRFQFSGGYSNTGSISTGADRLSFGAMIGDAFYPGAALSYRATVGIKQAPDGTPAYVGQSLQYNLPFAPRQEFALYLSLTDTVEEPDFFIVDSRTFEIVLSYATALSNFYDLPGDLRIAFESRDQAKELYFGEDLFLGEDRFAARQFVIGWSNEWRSNPPDGPSIRHGIEAALHVSPGDLGANNSDEDVRNLTLGRVTSASYMFLTGGYDLNTRLVNGRPVSVKLSGQWANDPLPETEQMSVGGLDAVRGYASEDGSYDRGIILRTQIGLTDRPIDADMFRINPYAFADAGFGRDLSLDEPDTVVGVGVGASVSIGNLGSATLVVGVPLVDGPANEAGEPRLHANVNFRF